MLASHDSKTNEDQRPASDGLPDPTVKAEQPLSSGATSGDGERQRRDCRAQIDPDVPIGASLPSHADTRNTQVARRCSLPPSNIVVIEHRRGATMPASPMESRMARLEGAYEQVSQRLMNIDPRLDGFDRKIDLRFDALDTKIEAVETKLTQRIDALEGRLDAKIDALEGRLDKKIDALEGRLDVKIDALDKKIDQRFMWTVGLIVTTWLTTIASIYLHH
jgi:tetrahydromethanopterin S-methyltransferase subunit G